MMRRVQNSPLKWEAWISITIPSWIHFKCSIVGKGALSKDCRRLLPKPERNELWEYLRHIIGQPITITGLRWRVMSRDRFPIVRDNWKRKRFKMDLKDYLGRRKTSLDSREMISTDIVGPLLLSPLGNRFLAPLCHPHSHFIFSEGNILLFTKYWHYWLLTGINQLHYWFSIEIYYIHIGSLFVCNFKFQNFSRRPHLLLQLVPYGKGVAVPTSSY